MKRSIFLLALATLFANCVLADESENYNFLFGFGLVTHAFSETDIFNEWEASEKEGKKTYNIKEFTGFEVFAEYFIFGDLAVGYKYQTMLGDKSYAVYYRPTESYGYDRREIEIDNHLGYLNYSIAVGESRYWRLGGSAGWGKSIYKFTYQYRPPVSDIRSEFNEKTDGAIVLLGLFADWGVDGSGGRIGYNRAIIDYDAIELSNGDKETPEGSGQQLFIDFRYAF